VTVRSKALLMTIGSFARASRLSVKALRLYDQHDLLKPREVDVHSGYRYYHPDQLDRARLIATLRELAMPLDVVADLLAGEDYAETDRRLAFWWAGQENVTRVRRGLVQSLRASFDPALSGADHSDEDKAAVSVAYRSVPQLLLLTEKRSVAVHRLPAFIAEAIGRLQPLTTTRAGTPDNPVVVIYHGRVNADSDGPVEVCLALEPDAPLEPRRLPTGVNHRRQDAHREAFVTLTKRQLVYPDILAAYDQIAARIIADGETTAGPPREYYFTDIRSAKPEQPVCHAAVPLA
jgi:DNA-binding transcriptional MerR regulator